MVDHTIYVENPRRGFRIFFERQRRVRDVEKRLQLAVKMRYVQHNVGRVLEPVRSGEQTFVVERRRFVRQLFRLILLVSLLSAGIQFAVCQETKPAARMIDTYGWMIADNAGGHADNFAMRLEREPDSYGYVVCYGPQGAGSGTAEYILQSLRSYLVQLRGIDADRINQVNGGTFDEPKQVRVELWIVPLGEAPPEPSHYNNKALSFSGKFVEYQTSDARGEGEDGGPPMGSVEIASFAEMLRNREDSVAYLVAYSYPNNSIGLWRRATDLIQDDLARYGISPDRIKVIYGGQKRPVKDQPIDEALVQFWILPKDAPPPAKEGKTEPAPLKAMQIGTYDEYWLVDTKEERRVFKGFADVLRSDKTLTVYLIVRPGITPVDSESSETAAKVDLLKLSQKWKTELRDKLDVSEDRIVVIESAIGEFNEGQLEVWVAPPGAPLPPPQTQEEIDDAEPKTDNLLHD